MGVLPLRMHRRRRLGAILSGVLMGAAGVALAGPETDGPVVVVGVDGMTFDLLDPLVRAGRLPHLGGMLARGARAVLLSEEPMRSPALWTTIATGQPRSVHRIYDFVTGSGYWPKELRGSRRQLVTSDMRVSPALWSMLGEQGYRSLVVGWLNTWPAEPIRGVMLAPYVALAQKRQSSIKGRLYRDAKRQSHPAQVFAEILPLVLSPEAVEAARVAKLIDEPTPGSALYRAIPKLERYLYTVRWSISATLTNTAAIERLLATRGPFDVVMTYFDGADTLAHRFWILREPLSQIRGRLRAHGFDPALAAELKRRFGSVVEGYYELVDDMLGRLQRAAGQNATFVILSDHGWGSSPGVRALHDETPFDGEHRLEGVLVVAGPGIHHGAAERLTLYDVAPTVLYLTGAAVPEDLPGRVATEMIRSELLARRPVRRVAAAAAAVAAPTPGSPRRSKIRAPHEDDEIERLRSLGYVQ